VVSFKNLLDSFIIDYDYEKKSEEFETFDDIRKGVNKAIEAMLEVGLLKSWKI
jgi:hypothetical protein